MSGERAVADRHRELLAERARPWPRRPGSRSGPPPAGPSWWPAVGRAAGRDAAADQRQGDPEGHPPGHDPGPTGSSHPPILPRFGLGEHLGADFADLSPAPRAVESSRPAPERPDSLRPMGAGERPQSGVVASPHGHRARSAPGAPAQAGAAEPRRPPGAPARRRRPDHRDRGHRPPSPWSASGEVAGSSRTLAYSHFRSRAALLAVPLRARAGRLHRAAPAAPGRGGPFEDRMRASISAYLDSICRAGRAVRAAHVRAVDRGRGRGHPPAAVCAAAPVLDGRWPWPTAWRDRRPRCSWPCSWRRPKPSGGSSPSHPGRRSELEDEYMRFAVAAAIRPHRRPGRAAPHG